MKTLTLSGWTQPAGALAETLDLPGLHSLDYSDYATPEASFAALDAYRDAERVIGWSLGGQLALRAIAAGILRPAQLVLIATPYQFVSDTHFRGGMDPVTYRQFRENYATDTARTMGRFAALMGKGDAEGKRISATLVHHPEGHAVARWLPWLDQLGTDSMRHLDLTRMPPTLIVHGEGDAIAPVAQGEMLAAQIPHARLVRWEGTGHAPHLRDSMRLTEQIRHFIA